MKECRTDVRRRRIISIPLQQRKKCVQKNKQTENRIYIYKLDPNAITDTKRIHYVFGYGTSYLTKRLVNQWSLQPITEKRRNILRDLHKYQFELEVTSWEWGSGSPGKQLEIGHVQLERRKKENGFLCISFRGEGAPEKRKLEFGLADAGGRHRIFQEPNRTASICSEWSLTSRARD